MDIVKHLLIIFFGISLLNICLSLMVWYRHRTSFLMWLVLMWSSGLIGLFTQGIFNQNAFLIAFGFSFNFFLNLSLLYLISKVINLPISWKISSLFLVLGWIMSYSVSLFSTQFIYIALPIALSITLPFFWKGTQILIKNWRGLSFSKRGLIFTMFGMLFHEVDFPFLRPYEELAALGFTIAILISIALSVFSMAAVLENITQEQTRVQSELTIAQTIQKEILPKTPRIPGMEVECFMNPAKEIGGDYYDVYTLNGTSWIFLGDVTGHGLASGLVMFMTQSIISSILETKKNIQPGELMGLTNKILFNNLDRLNERRPMTLLSFRCRNDEILVSGSHDPFYIFRAENQTLETLNVAQFPIGVGFSENLNKEELTEKSIRLNPGDLLFVGTDGIIEAPSRGDYKRGLFSERRLTDFLQRNGNYPLVEIKANLIQELKEFTSGIFHDDVTFILLRLKSK